MTLRRLLASGLIAAAAVAPALADGGKAPVRVSTEVIRSCRVTTVTTDQPQVAVTCGSRPQSVQVSYTTAASASRAVAAQTPASPASVESVIIHF